MNPGGRPSHYGSQLERLLHVMLTTSEEDGTISRYRLKIKTASWLRKRDLDSLLKDAGLTEHTRTDRWKGKYYLTSEVAEKLAEITERKTQQLRQVATEIEDFTNKPW